MSQLWFCWCSFDFGVQHRVHVVNIKNVQKIRCLRNSNFYFLFILQVFNIKKHKDFFNFS